MSLIISVNNEGIIYAGKLYKQTLYKRTRIHGQIIPDNFKNVFTDITL